LSTEDIANLAIGDVVYVSGTVYTARDMAHIRMAKCLAEGEPLGTDFTGSIIFHAGPVVKEVDGELQVLVIGPTTSIRMEPFSELVFGKLGVKALIGKGGMGESTQSALMKYRGVYLLAAPGCAVVLAKSIRRVLAVQWKDLGMPEAIWTLEVKDLGPLIVAMDSHGQNLFNQVKERALQSMKRILAEQQTQENTS
jgi:fumarate hydratase subunit beta/L(+)-tartrate dehydratase beta subunit